MTFLMESYTRLLSKTIIQFGRRQVDMLIRLDL